jgi:hypothetical protein
MGMDTVMDTDMDRQVQLERTLYKNKERWKC